MKVALLNIKTRAYCGQKIFLIERSSIVRIFSLLFSFYVPLQNVYGQDNIDLKDRECSSLSQMADFYYTANNYDKAIDYERKVLLIKDSIYGIKSIQYASSSINIAKYYYARGCTDTISASLPYTNDFSNAINYLTIAVNTIKDSLLWGFYEMDSQEKYQIWQSINGLFDSTLPSYVAKYPNDSTISELYNSTIFSNLKSADNFSSVRFSPCL